MPHTDVTFVAQATTGDPDMAMDAANMEIESLTDECRCDHAAMDAALSLLDRALELPAASWGPYVRAAIVTLREAA